MKIFLIRFHFFPHQKMNVYRIVHNSNVTHICLGHVTMSMRFPASHFYDLNDQSM